MGEESKRGEKSSNPDTFSTGQSVYCVPAAFCIYSVKFKYPPFSRCFPCVPPPQLLSDELEMLDSGPRGKRPKTATIAFPAPVSAKKQQAGTAWGQCHPLQTIRREETKTLSQGP